MKRDKRDTSDRCDRNKRVTSMNLVSFIVNHCEFIAAIDNVEPIFSSTVCTVTIAVLHASNMVSIQPNVFVESEFLSDIFVRAQWK